MFYNFAGQTFTHRQSFPIQHPKITGALSDFSMKIRVSDMDPDFVDLLKSDAGDCWASLADGSTRTAVHIQEFDQSGYDGAVVALIAAVSPSINTNMYLYGGNPALSQPVASDQYGSEAATRSTMTIHLTKNEAPVGAGDVLLDTTASANHGDPNNTMLVGDSVAGVVGKGVYYDGGTHETIIADDASHDRGAAQGYMITMAAKLPVTTAGAHDKGTLMAKVDTVNDTYSDLAWFATDNHPTNVGKIVVLRSDGTNTTQVGWSANAYNDGGWHLISYGTAGGNMYLKIDGDTIMSAADVTTGTTTASGYDRKIGRLPGGWLAGTFGFEGVIDELTFDTMNYSEAEHDAVYANIITNDLYVAGALEVPNPESWVSLVVRSPNP